MRWAAAMGINNTHRALTPTPPPVAGMRCLRQAKKILAGRGHLSSKSVIFVVALRLFRLAAGMDTSIEIFGDGTQHQNFNYPSLTDLNPNMAI